MSIDLLAIQLISARNNVFQYTDGAAVFGNRTSWRVNNVCVHASDTDIILLINKLKLPTPNTTKHWMNWGWNAAEYHTLRVYHTVQEWRGHNLDPKKCSFFDFDAKLESIAYTEPLGPRNLHKIILCNCSKSACQSGKWSCKNFQLYCDELCGCLDNCTNICSINDEVDVDTQEDSN